MQRVLLRVVCVLALLFAQQSALTHAAWHAGAAAPAQQDSKGGLHGGSCDLHYAYAQVLGGVQSTAALCLAEPVIHEPAIARVAAVGVTRFLAPLSRGPPPYF